MKPLRALAFAALCLACLPASALTLEALPGATPQATRQGAFFPNPIAVRALDETGAPVAGVAVQLTFPFPEPEGSVGWACFMVAGASCNLWVGVTDADGVARTELMGMLPGPVALTAQAGEATAALDLTVDAGLPWSMKVLGGQGQSTRVGTTFAEPWTVQVLGQDHKPVPYANVYFWVVWPDGPAGTFADGTQTIWNVKADVEGIASAPAFTANAISGHGLGLAGAWGRIDQRDYQVHVLIQYTNTPEASR